MHYQSRKYTRLIKWIACNDNAGEAESIEEIAGYLSVVMVADCYDLPSISVAKDVMEERSKP